MTKPAFDAELDGDFDIQIAANGDILTRDFFDTALLMSLFCERRALPSEVPESERRRGWIGNESTPGFEVGSKLWLYYQARATRTILGEVESVVVDGLQWMIDDGIAQKIVANSIFSNGQISIDVLITRPSSKVDRRYFEIWDNTGTN